MVDDIATKFSPENPTALSDERSLQAYNGHLVSSPERLAQLKDAHPKFRGDWRQLEILEAGIDGNTWDTQTGPVGIAALMGSGVHLEGAQLSKLKLANWWIRGAHLEGATFLGANLERACFEYAHLEGAEFYGANLRHASLRYANLYGASIQHADLEGANLAGANLERANIHGANLSLANVRNVSGLEFSNNAVHRLQIEGNAPDHWSVLRRKYTGPWFLCNMLLLVGFFAPYIAQVMALSITARGQHWAEHAGSAFVEHLSEKDPAHGQIYESALNEAKIRLSERFEATPAIWVLLGGTKHWWVCAGSFIVIFYNVVRLILTLQVGMLRDAEERSAITPSRAEYLEGHIDWPRLARCDLGAIRFNLWRTHQFAWYVWWGAVLFVAANALHWVLTTTVPVPR